MSTLAVKESSVKEAIDKIEKKKYFLHAIQREFVWNEYQITSFFDSLLRGYHIGAFLFWEIKGKMVTRYTFYEFLEKYDACPLSEYISIHNKVAEIERGREKVTAILDGQQRLTALYIGLKGSYASHTKNTWRDRKKSYPDKYLYLNLFYELKDVAGEEDEWGKDLSYKISFHDPEKLGEPNAEQFWFKVGNVFDSKLRKAIKKDSKNNELKIDVAIIKKYLKNKGISASKYGKNNYENATVMLENLCIAIYAEGTIHYFLEREQSLKKVLDMFIRLNSGGTRLSYPDLLLSMATAEWKDNAAREEVNDLADKINNYGFNISKNIILKSCLVLVDGDFKFRAGNFKKDNMALIEKSWGGINKSMQDSVELIHNWGYSGVNFLNYNPLISIAYYLNKRGIGDSYFKGKRYEKDRDKILEWLIFSTLSRTFGEGRGDKVLREMRNIIKEFLHQGFPLAEIKNKFPKDGIPFLVDKEGIDSFVNELTYWHPHTYNVLSCVYLPSAAESGYGGKLHKDHIFSREILSEEKLRDEGVSENIIQYCVDNCNCFANLQLLTPGENSRKRGKSLERWLEEECNTKKKRDDFKRKHFIPLDLDLVPQNFEKFIEKRKKLLKDKLEELCKL